MRPGAGLRGKVKVLWGGDGDEAAALRNRGRAQFTCCVPSLKAKITVSPALSRIRGRRKMGTDLLCVHTLLGSNSHCTCGELLE